MDNIQESNYTHYVITVQLSDIFVSSIYLLVLFKMSIISIDCYLHGRIILCRIRSTRYFLINCIVTIGNATLVDGPGGKRWTVEGWQGEREGKQHPFLTISDIAQMLFEM